MCSLRSLTFFGLFEKVHQIRHSTMNSILNICWRIRRSFLSHIRGFYPDEPFGAACFISLFVGTVVGAPCSHGVGKDVNFVVVGTGEMQLSRISYAIPTKVALQSRPVFEFYFSESTVDCKMPVIF